MSDGTGGGGTPAPVIPVPPPAGPTAEQIQAWQAQAAEAEALRAKLTAAEAGAKAWERHQAEQAAALKSRTDAYVAGRPEQVRARVQGRDPSAIAVFMDTQAALAPPAAPPAPAVPPAPVYPPGGGSGAPVGGVVLTTAEQDWIRNSRPDLARVSPEVARRAFTTYGPGKSAVK